MANRSLDEEEGGRKDGGGDGKGGEAISSFAPDEKGMEEQSGCLCGEDGGGFDFGPRVVGVARADTDVTLVGGGESRDELAREFS